MEKRITELTQSILSTWKTNNRITVFLIENLSPDLWSQKVPGYKQKTVQMIAGHLHNTRCMWIKTVGIKFGLTIPDSVDRHHLLQEELISALYESSREIISLLKKGIEHGEALPGFSLDVVHFLNYLIAHEAHHRGQIIMVGRQLGHKLPEEVTHGIWHWSKRSKEV